MNKAVQTSFACNIRSIVQAISVFYRTRNLTAYKQEEKGLSFSTACEIARRSTLPAEMGHEGSFLRVKPTREKR
jgi:hypothetical protein